MKIISHKICPFVQRVNALLEAKGIEYEIEYIHLNDKPQWFLDVSPTGQVPVLITDSGKVLFESDAIVEYLDEAYPALQPEISLEDKALNRAWSHLASKNYLVQCSAQRSPDADVFEKRSEKLGRVFDTIENQLGDDRFFSGSAVGMVDIAWIPLLHRAEIISRRTSYDYIGNRPKLKKWQSAVIATGLAEKSVAKDFEQVFVDFYVTEKTFLGRRRTVHQCSS